MSHPGCDWAIIPDVIDGDEAANDELIERWPFGRLGVPVWHYHESLDRLVRLCEVWPRVALGSSGQWPTPGLAGWWQRTNDVMEAICRDGRPIAKLHGLRMLNPDIFTRLPLSSADSCNAGRNCGAVADRLELPADAAAEVIIRRIEANNSAARWVPVPVPEYADLFG